MKHISGSECLRGVFGCAELLFFCVCFDFRVLRSEGCFTICLV